MPPSRRWWLVLVALGVSGCAGRPAPSIAVVDPENHSSWRVDPVTGAVQEVVVTLDIHHFDVPKDGVVHITGEKIGEYADHVEHALPTPSVRLTGVELGTHFWTFSLVDKNGSAVGHTTLHIEIVLPQDTALPQWHYMPSTHDRRPKILVNLPLETRTRRQSKLCLVGSSSGLFDGQKKIWLQAIAALPQHEWKVSFVAFEPLAESSVFVNRLRQMNVSVYGVPLVVQAEDFAAFGLEPSQAIPTAVQAFHEAFYQFENISMHTFREHTEKLHPPFARRLWEGIVDALHAMCDGSVLVMSNSRNLADEFLVTAARIAGVRAVAMELANLQPVPLTVDALVAPSHYALHHPSVQGTVAAHQQYVLNTGVNTTLFRPRETTVPSSTFVIGYVGRLSTDKSIGLVLDAARLLAKSCPRRCKLRIIGDGPLRVQLESLAQEWGLTGLVQFMGGIYTETLLARALRHLDVAVSPRFHETLGIAPLEAMSCGMPVVGFATGGVSEYLEHNVNGLVVPEPTAEALHDALVLLRDNHTLRQRLGEQARRTVVTRFAHDVGIQQFVRLYERLARFKES